jgi:hypothetical protein
MRRRSQYMREYWWRQKRLRDEAIGNGKVAYGMNGCWSRIGVADGGTSSLT